MPTGTTRIRLRPANTSRIPFWGQLAIGGFWLAYVLFSMRGDSGANDYHFLHWVFLVFTFVYIGYVLVHNAPIFGTQSYLEFTPGYIVHKAGLFRRQAGVCRRKHGRPGTSPLSCACTKRRRSLRPQPARSKGKNAQKPLPGAGARICGNHGVQL